MEKDIQKLRVLKLAERLGLESATIENLKAELLGEVPEAGTFEFPLSPDVASYEPQRPPLMGFGALEDSGTLTMPINVRIAEESQDFVGGQSISPSMPPIEAELKLRQKIEAEQNWGAFRHDAWQLYEAYPRPDVAGRLCELAFLYGSAAELEDVVASLLRESIEFWSTIEADVRLHIVLKLWSSRRTGVLDGLLFQKTYAWKLLPIERLYCCRSFLQSGEVSRAYRYFRKHDQDIWSAAKSYASHLRQSEHEFALIMGRAALGEGDEVLATQLLESIPRYAPEFQKALDILLDIRIERNEQGLCPYGQKLQRELDWKGRITLFDSFLLRIQRFEASAPKDRAALNELLRDPFRWLPETPEAWQAMVETLLDYQQLEYLLPNLSYSLQVKAMQFLKPPFDHAIWFPVSQHEFADAKKSAYWKCVCLLHEFTWTSGQKEELLWDALACFREAEECEGQSLQPSWYQLHHALMQWISKSSRIDEQKRKSLLLVIKLMGDAKDISEADIARYLAETSQPSQQVMHSLENLVRQRGQAELESYLVERKASIFHYTNSDLQNLWTLAAKLKRYDQCWRIASVTRSRMVLNPEVERHWAISGEKKREFSILSLQDAHLKIIFQSFEGAERKLVEALLSVGGLVPELLASINSQLVPVKKGKGLTSQEEEVHNVLEHQTWLPQGRKIYSSHPSGLWHVKPPLFASLLDTKWAVLFMALAQRFGVSSWDWQLSLLHHQIESLVPRMSRGVETPSTGKVGRWLRSLSPQQRKSWYDLAQLSRRFTDEQAQLIIARFIGKVSVTMLQDHALVLQSLEKLRAPLRLRWDLENWIVSDAYGDIRRSLSSATVGHFASEVYELALLGAR